jgi:hypothetical protein
LQVGHALAQQDFSHPNLRRRQLKLAHGVRPKPLDDQSGADSVIAFPSIRSAT